MPIKHLLSISDLDPEELARLVDRSYSFATKKNNGHASLAGKIVGIYFRRSSTRTRTSFTVGALKLGAQTVAYGPNDLQIATGETIEDTGRVLTNYLDALVIRTNESDEEMRVLASQQKMAVINAMSEVEHPTQAIADLSILKEQFGQLKNLHLLYLGEGNNTASALAWAAARTPGMKITFVTPKNYGLPESTLSKVCKYASQQGSEISQHHNMDKLPQRIDAVYTTRWQTMGVTHPDPDWYEMFLPYSVTQSILRKVSKPSGTIFLHDLPAVRGDEVSDEVLNGPQSLAWRQAQHKLFAAMAILDWCLNNN
jgi:ornithine carbamoyltransferase